MLASPMSPRFHQASPLPHVLDISLNRPVERSETPVGVEPTYTGLQPVAVPSGSSVVEVSSPGIEPGPRPPQSRVRSGTLQGHVKFAKQPAEESNPVL